MWLGGRLSWIGADRKKNEERDGPTIKQYLQHALGLSYWRRLKSLVQSILINSHALEVICKIVCDQRKSLMFQVIFFPICGRSVDIIEIAVIRVGLINKCKLKDKF